MKGTSVPLGFLPKPLLISVEALLPSVKLDARFATSQKYLQIRDSIREIGLIEPLIGSAVIRKTSQHTVLDGHLRLQAMKDIGLVEVPCLVSTDDETFTYNNQISRLSTIQEHQMIRHAIERGISIAKLAKGLCVDVSHVKKKSTLLDGICKEVIELLKDRQFSTLVTPILRRMKPTRQLECVELMVAANSLTASYAQALCAATPTAMLIDGKPITKRQPLSQEQHARMENEMAGLQAQYKIAEQSHGEDVFNLMLARGYIVKLMDNPRVMKYMQSNYSEVLEEFSRIAEMTSIEA
ncbi:ParB N-terminal domain-containing protein [Diaphorobacter sp. HDW4B]|uniref:plasmid partitioning protein RepB C-terminal domain-containing protein n=1 Tax=Diaphorobacter sp. HDW4B TaxID=2714925 RepID=UPI00140C3994|nr:plasmid partitioning protein RepB C-terminal domain-containing protein [Diaphorobacter sp. HDW4B]QIL71016.1 ParB N-terminal domain-containing protein [Diaphorobacter sp. HDW4B]